MKNRYRYGARLLGLLLVVIIGAGCDSSTPTDGAHKALTAITATITPTTTAPAPTTTPPPPVTTTTAPPPRVVIVKVPAITVPPVTTTTMTPDEEYLSDVSGFIGSLVAQGGQPQGTTGATFPTLTEAQWDPYFLQWGTEVCPAYIQLWGPMYAQPGQLTAAVVRLILSAGFEIVAINGPGQRQILTAATEVWCPQYTSDVQPWYAAYAAAGF